MKTSAKILKLHEDHKKLTKELALTAPITLLDALDDLSELRCAVERMTSACVNYIRESNGEDWKERLPLWRNEMTTEEGIILDVALAGLAILEDK